MARRSILAGVLVAVAVLAGGVAILSTQQARWSARASTVVLPAASLDSLEQADYYATLSQGQIVATFAEMLRLQRFEHAAAERVRLSPEDRQATSTSVDVVPGTAVIVLSVTAPDPALANSMANLMIEEWNVYLAELSTPYSVSVIGLGAPTEQKVGAVSVELGAVLLFVALGTGFVTQQAIVQLASALHGRGGDTAATAASRSRFPPSSSAGSAQAMPDAFYGWYSPGDSLNEPDEPLGDDETLGGVKERPGSSRS